jgi:hypothetical protein
LLLLVGSATSRISSSSDQQLRRASIRLLQEENEADGEEGAENQQQADNDANGEEQPEENNQQQQEGYQEAYQENAYGQAEEQQANGYQEYASYFSANEYYAEENAYGEEAGEEQSGVSNFVTDLLFRIDEDMYEMWNNSPSQWAAEYWEVLVVLGSLVFFVLMCVCYVCCIVPFCANKNRRENDDDDDVGYGDPHSGGRMVATPSEMEKHLQAKKRRLFGKNKSASTKTINEEEEDYEAPFVRMDDNGNPSYAEEINGTNPGSPRSGGEESDVLPHDYSEYTDGAISPRSVSKKKKSFLKSSRKSGFKNDNSNLFIETIDVWSEFLGFKNTKYNVKEAVDVGAVDDGKRVSSVKGASPRKSKTTRTKKGRSSSSVASKSGAVAETEDNKETTLLSEEEDKP